MYVPIPELVKYIPALARSDNKVELEGIVAALIDDASRQFDSETQAPEGYYRNRPTDLFYSRKYISNGSNFFHVHHFETFGDVLIGDTSMASRARIRDNQTIEVARHRFYYSDDITINARWGWKNIPEDIKSAVAHRVRLEMANTNYIRLDFDDGGLGEGSVLDLRSSWSKVVERYRYLNKFAYEGAGYGEPVLLPLVSSDPDGDSLETSSPFVFTQPTAISEWVINHNLNRKPNIVVRNLSNAIVVASIQHVSNNQARILYTTPQAGYARCI